MMRLLAWIAILVVWHKLPSWIRLSLQIVFLFVSCTVLLVFYRLGIFDELGQAFADIGRNILELLKDLGVLAIYGISGHCLGAEKCVP